MSDKKTDKSWDRKKTLRKVLRFLKPYLPLLILSLFLGAATVILQLYSPILAGRAIDHIIGPGNVETKLLAKIITIFLVLTGCAFLTQWVQSVINNRIVFHVVQDIRTKAFRHMQELPLEYIDKQSTGDVVSRLIGDIDQFSDGLLLGFSQLFSGLTTIVLTLVFMFTLNVWIALLVVVLTPASLFLASFIAKRTFHLFRKQSEQRGALTGLVEEMVGNEKVVQAFGYEDTALDRFEVINDSLAEASKKATFYSSLTNPGTRFVNNLIYAGVGILGASFAIAGRLSVGDLTVFLSYANQYTKPFNEISGVITELQNSMACAERVFELLEEAPEVPEPADAKVLDAAVGEVQLTNVHFSYDKSKTLLTDLNLHVKPGKRVAIVGPTGCGKSTLINLLMRFYDVDHGSIEVDGTDIRKLTRHSLRANYGMVLQETWLKKTSVRDNIAYGKPDATDEEIQEAARLTHADRFIRRMPEGYDTILGEDGGSLSQGQKQLLCITRVMLRLPPMLILDEATSSIDTRTEHRIQRSFAKMMEGRTSFIVAHRLSTIQEADVILVMKDGNIIEQGDHESLLRKGGFYSELYNSQFEVADV
ncbi:MAG: ABC transporter ATP-binding protein/permease [Eubacterium sp.]|nr:ABC transporter ATP-binding protein/permease [Eubacterium sp.]